MNTQEAEGQRSRAGAVALKSAMPEAFHSPSVLPSSACSFVASDRGPDELWTEVRDIVQETGIKTIPMKRNAKKQNGCLGRPYK